MPSTSRGSRRDFAALEARRYGAARLFARGESQAAVARALGATRAAAHRWFHAWQDQGRTALKAAGRAGRREKKRAAPPGLDRLRRREWRLASTGGPPHLGPARPPAGFDPHGRQLVALVDCGGLGLPLGWPASALLLPDAARQLQRSCADRLSARPQAPLPRPPYHRGLGRTRWAHEPRDAAVSRSTTVVGDGRTTAGLRSRVESRRADLGQHQAPRAREPLPGRHPSAARAASGRVRAHPSPTVARRRLLAARGFGFLAWS